MSKNSTMFLIATFLITLLLSNPIFISDSNFVIENTIDLVTNRGESVLFSLFIGVFRCIC